jgi:hypothetical protein
VHGRAQYHEEQDREERRRGYAGKGRQWTPPDVMSDRSFLLADTDDGEDLYGGGEGGDGGELRDGEDDLELQAIFDGAHARRESEGTRPSRRASRPFTPDASEDPILSATGAPLLGPAPALLRYLPQYAPPLLFSLLALHYLVVVCSPSAFVSAQN